MDTSPSFSSAEARRRPALTAAKWLMVVAVLIVVLASPTVILSFVG